MNWIYNNVEFLSIPENCEGFVYKITNLTNGKFYIGRKSFYSYSKKKLTLADKKLPGNSRKTFKIDKKETSWRKYTGSCKELNSDIKSGNKYIKEILRLCETRKQLTAWEMKYIFCDGILEDNCYNGNIGGKIFKNDFK